MRKGRQLAYYLFKVLFSAVVIVIVTEVAKRSTFIGALVASLPLISIIAMVWLYIDTKDLEKVSALSIGIFWIVIPSLLFFLAFPFLVKWKENFWLALSLSSLITASAYWAYSSLLSKLGIQI